MGGQRQLAVLMQLRATATTAARGGLALALAAGLQQQRGEQARGRRSADYDEVGLGLWAEPKGLVQWLHGDTAPLVGLFEAPPPQCRKSSQPA